MEDLLSVDCILAAMSIRYFWMVLLVLSALPRLVTVRIVANTGWRVASMGSSGPGRVIGFHNVELRAPVTVDLISITVAPAIGVNPSVP